MIKVIVDPLKKYLQKYQSFH